MSRFTEILREINERLDLPQPTKSRILIEIASDLEDIYAYYRDSGHTEEDAKTRAIEYCDFTDETLSQLIHIHTSWYRKFLDRFSEQAQTRWERTILITLLLFVAVFTGRLVLTIGVFQVANAAVWPVLAMTSIAVILSLQKLYTIYIKRDHDPHRLRAGLTVIVVLAGINLLFGLYGSWLALYEVARQAVIDSEQVLPEITRWLFSSSATLMVCFFTAILAALLWFLLENSISRLEKAEASMLLE